MDGKRFDHLTRLVGAGASRRSILKGLLGLGGAAISGAFAAEQADARSIGTRPSIPSRPSTTPPPTTTTPAPCPGQQQCPGSTLCCDVGTCARSGNQTICCDGSNGHGTVVCGLDCCDSPYECCDNECCADGHICLTRVFPEGPNVEEEVCCPAHLACDNQCCDGACFDPVYGVIRFEEEEIIFNGHPVAVASTLCCPSGDSVCQVDFGNHQCCGGETPKCCPVDPSTETSGACRAADACCNASDCAADNPGTDPECWTCREGVCVPVQNDVSCGQSGEVCCDQICCAAGQICVQAPNGETGAAQEAHICLTTTTTTTAAPIFQLSIRKIVSGTTNPLTGACFAVYAGSCPESGSPVASGCVQGPADADPGQIGFFLPAGDYCVVETQTPDGYDPAGSLPVALTSNIVLYVGNERTTTTTSTTTTTTSSTTTTTTTAAPLCAPPCSACYACADGPSGLGCYAAPNGTDPKNDCAQFGPCYTCMYVEDEQIARCAFDCRLDQSCCDSGCADCDESGSCSIPNQDRCAEHETCEEDTCVCDTSQFEECEQDEVCCPNDSGGVSCVSGDICPTTTTTPEPCPRGSAACGTICCTDPTPYCLDPVFEYCGECLSEADCNGNICCFNVCCNADEICPGTDRSSEVSIAAVGCCKPDPCPTGNLGDQCGTFNESSCGLELTCNCTVGTCGQNGQCCSETGGGCSIDGDCCDVTDICNSFGVCGCLGEGQSCAGDHDCCNGDCNSHGYCGCVGETQSCTTGDICCESRVPGGPQPCPGSACTLN
ncbi:MAG: prealbumin-like fold domain-containing protein [Thermomicrobiales bacterium]